MRLNISVVYNINKDKILMCLRSKNPYKGLYNFVGGKLEEGEDPLEGAYRELVEETGITKNDINLTHLMNFFYKLIDVELNVYVGSLNKEVDLVEEVNSLCWIDANENFFDMKRFAGEGNIGHIIETINLNKEKYLCS